jgi:hypothetical protein
LPAFKPIFSGLLVSMKKVLFFFLVLLFLPIFAPASESPALMIHGVVKNVRESIDFERDYGYYQRIVIRKLNGDNRVTNEEVRLYRTTWIEGKPYAALVSVNDKQPCALEKSKEWQRRGEFIKSIKGTSQTSGMYQELQAIQWGELYKAYDFQLTGSDFPGLQTLTFHPNGQADDRTKFEKVFHRLEGTISLDPSQNVVRATADLTEPVKFGWGIVARVDELHIQFQQQKHLSVWVPAHLILRFKARIALFKTQRQEIIITWFNPFPKPPLLQTAEEMVPGQQPSAGQR